MTTDTDNSVVPESDQNQPRIAVIGDIMVDVDVHCTAERLCQEGPWPVYSQHKITQRMGGAGNVLEMLCALECKAILCGLVGQDDHKTIPASGSMTGWQIVPGRTTTKTRFLVDAKLTGPRWDSDNLTPATQQTADAWDRILRTWRPDAVIVADHGKGAVSKEVMMMLGELGVPVFLDPVKTTPSLCGNYPAAIVGHLHEMPAWEWTRSECCVTKHGSDGLHWCHDKRIGRLQSSCGTLVDPLGAGDQFIAALSYQRSIGASWEYAIEWANIAAGLQCERAGCVPVSKHDVDARQSTGSK